MTADHEKSIARSIDKCESDMISTFEQKRAARPEGAVRYDVIENSPFYYCGFLRGNGIRVSREVCRYLGDAYITEIGLIFECTAMRDLVKGVV